MGLICTYLSFRNVTQKQVINGLETCSRTCHAFISPDLNDWVTCFIAEIEGPNEEEIEKFGGIISRFCQRRCLGLSVIHSDVLGYWAFDRKGDLKDKSFPNDLYQRLNMEERKGLLGDPRSLPGILELDVNGEDIKKCLEEDTVYRDQNLQKLSNLSRIKNYLSSYSDFERSGFPLAQQGIVGLNEFVHFP